MTDKPTPSPEQMAHVDALMAELDATIAAKGLHPIVKPVLVLLQNEDATWWPQGMPIERVEEFRTLVEQAQEEKTLVPAIYDLLRVAVAVGSEPGGKLAGAYLLALCEQVIEQKNLIGIVRGDNEFAPGTLAKAKGAVGDTHKTTAPKLGEKAPAGAMRIDQLPGGLSKRRL